MKSLGWCVAYLEMYVDRWPRIEFISLWGEHSQHKQTDMEICLHQDQNYGEKSMQIHLDHNLKLSLGETEVKYYPGQKKEPSTRFAARRTLFHRVISCSMTHDQRRAKVADSRRWLCPALIVRHRARYQKIEQHSSHRESGGWFFFFCQG